MDAISAMVSTVVVLASTPVAWAAVRAYRMFDGLRLVNCPETVEAAIVKINATRAIASKVAGGNALRLRACSRWPERQGCDQACLGQILAAPDGCRVRALPRGSRPPRPEARVSRGLAGTTGFRAK